MKRTKSLMHSVETGRRTDFGSFRTIRCDLPHFHRVLDQKTYGDTEYSRAPLRRK
ncbi:hypothetical protein K443DRAFT_420699 [Laccaria amethystina LaAM-08-1]|uniref:Uncharacterized protein n=1 Tax=Laccaria amethystina LaAM-08-1 TaxID=1095629 RepID=A0A0C9WVK1_9AGAR|nr:hypothetical protein K443DRAFT_420699 [Laccaria amethystina LaAM-08-1]